MLVVGQTSIKLLISFRLSGEHICTRVLSIPSILLIIVIITVMAVPFSISTLWICKRKRCNEAMDIDFSLLPSMCSLHCAHCALCSISIQCEMLKLFKSSEFFVYFHTGEDFKVHHLFNMSLSIFLFSTSDFLKATNRL